MSVEFRVDPLAGEDPDATVELPVPDFAATGTLPALDETATLQAHSPSTLLETGSQPVLTLPEAAGELAQDLRAAEARLARKDDRLALAELALAAAQASELQLRESRESEIAALQEQAEQALERERELARRAVQELQDELLKATQARAAQAAMAHSLQEQATQDRAAQAAMAHSLQEQAAQTAARAEDLTLALAQQRKELDAERDQALATRQRLAEQNAERSELQRQLQELREVSARQLEALRSLEGYRGISDAQLDARERHIMELETQVQLLQALEQQREAEREQLAQQLREAMQRLADQQAAGSGLETVRGELVARVARLEQELVEVRVRAEMHLAQREQQHADALADQQATLQLLQAEHTSLSEHVVEREQDLRAAEEQVGRVEAEVSHRDTRIQELTRGNDLLSQRLADVRREIAERDGRIRALEAQVQANASVLTNLHQTIQRLGREEVMARAPVGEISLENATRELVLDLDGEVRVFALARRTTVGRTADNDIALDTGFISRHHAVLLASSRHTILEDLNSTNGVRVNGHRITRQVLSDGDLVTIGKTDFRYRVRHGVVRADEARLP